MVFVSDLTFIRLASFAVGFVRGELVCLCRGCDGQCIPRECLLYHESVIPMPSPPSQRHKKRLFTLNNTYKCAHINGPISS